MSFTDKVRHTGEEAGGKLKEGAGKLTGNEDLAAEGRRDQAAAEVKKAGDKVGDAAKDAAGEIQDAAKHAFGGKDKPDAS